MSGEEMKGGCGVKVNEGAFYLLAKRIIDIVGAIVAIIIFAPVFILAIITVKLEDLKSPVFFGHVRIGYLGEEFKCWKFRTMIKDADCKLDEILSEEQKRELRENFKIKDDPRITKTGKFLRDTSIDELPQFFNVLIGQMSIVGPRPVVKEELKLYGEYQKVLVQVTPGITGVWQVNGRSDTTYEERVQMDMYYAQNRSIVMDVKLVFKTVISVLKKEGAY